jgi:DNA end-binding protein Ku
LHDLGGLQKSPAVDVSFQMTARWGRQAADSPFELGSTGTPRPFAKEKRAMARAIWKGAVSFGLVTLPVKIVSALRDRTVHFHMLSKDGQCRLRQKLYCPETGEEYDFKQAARGYEVAPDQYVILNEDELGRLEVEAGHGHAIRITDFVDMGEIDPIYYDRAYYLVPDELGAKSYQLLLRAMSERGKVGIGKVVMRDREHLVALRPMDGIIGLETMRYADEIVDRNGLALADTEVDPKELELAQQLIEALDTKFDPDRYKDEYRERLNELIERKAEGKEIVTQSPDQPGKGEVIHLMEALRKSLEQAKARGAAPVKKKAAAGKKA